MKRRITICDSILALGITMLAARAAIFIWSPAWGFHDLHEAVRYTNLRAARYFIRHGADVNSRNASGSTPLHCAVDRCWTVSASGLRRTALSEHDCEPIIRLLIASGADVSARDNDGNTPLHIAVEEDWNIKVVHLLVQHGASVNVVNKEGETPLDIANKHGAAEIAGFLRAHGGKQGSDEVHVPDDHRSSITAYPVVPQHRRETGD